jgi:hypothetical protein
MIERFQQLGGVFFLLCHQPAPDPLALIDEEGGGITGELQHPTLAVDVHTALTRFSGGEAAEAAWGNIGYYPAKRTVSLSQSANLENTLGVNPDVVALGLVNFALFYNDHLGPRYGWVDELGHTGPSEARVAQLRPQYLFWANLFGPEFAQAVGLDFLEAAPGGTVVRLDNGGALYLATESFLDWREHGQPEVLAHFRRKFPRLRRYEARFLAT